MSPSSCALVQRRQRCQAVRFAKRGKRRMKQTSAYSHRAFARQRVDALPMSRRRFRRARALRREVAESDKRYASAGGVEPLLTSSSSFEASQRLPWRRRRRCRWQASEIAEQRRRRRTTLRTRLPHHPATPAPPRRPATTSRHQGPRTPPRPDRVQLRSHVIVRYGGSTNVTSGQTDVRTSETRNADQLRHALRSPLSVSGSEFTHLTRSTDRTRSCGRSRHLLRVRSQRRRKPACRGSFMISSELREKLEETLSPKQDKPSTPTAHGDRPGAATLFSPR
ncbi:PREDICTED: uncharacterized protein LOC106815552 [Priapulus caudatus]|uniref:Uncharacterized protein LOC106815552 n=1 Tax=Priapulus caudatus TaxID=37621 RepID=A0ABM1ETI5_PRICU|nr:PREDICTED: uncharacterized protein LOC106815552 [Priapulus caudatus]